MPRYRQTYGPEPSKTGHELYAPIRACRACRLRDTCSGPVPSVGSLYAPVMLVGEAPGAMEDRWGIPFTGPTWTELERYLRIADLNRDSVVLANTVKCRPAGDPTLEDTRECFDRWFHQEVAQFQPRVIVAMGQLAIRRLLDDPALLVSETHGYPVWSDTWDAWVLPTYHPSAGLHQEHYLPALYDDFQSLKELLRDDSPRVRAVDDMDGRESYRLVELGGNYTDFTVAGPLQVAMDIETTPAGGLWCASYSYGAGRGFVIKDQVARVLQPAFSGTQVEPVFHNGLFDIPRLMQAGLSVHPGTRIHDTFIMARLLQLDEAGLKALSHRIAGMKMRSYDSVVGAAQPRLSWDYLCRALAIAGKIALNVVKDSRSRKGNVRRERNRR